MDPLIKMAVGHYQFEAIHPFRDECGPFAWLIGDLLLGLVIHFVVLVRIINFERYYHL